MYTESTYHAAMKRTRYRHMTWLEAVVAGGTFGLDAIDEMGSIDCGIEARSRAGIRIKMVRVGSGSSIHRLRCTKAKEQ
jgi:hypothetical protein